MTARARRIPAEKAGGDAGATRIFVEGSGTATKPEVHDTDDSMAREATPAVDDRDLLRDVQVFMTCTKLDLY